MYSLLYAVSRTQNSLGNPIYTDGGSMSRHYIFLNCTFYGMIWPLKTCFLHITSSSPFAIHIIPIVNPEIR